MDNWLKTAAVVCWVFGWSAVIAECLKPTLHVGFLGIGFFAFAATASLACCSKHQGRYTRRALYLHHQEQQQQLSPAMPSNVRRLHG